MQRCKVALENPRPGLEEAQGSRHEEQYTHNYNTHALEDNGQLLESLAGLDR